MAEKDQTGLPPLFPSGAVIPAGWLGGA